VAVDDTLAIRAAQHATATIPIVMGGTADAVASGFVASLTRPGGNITGVHDLGAEISGKRLELLKETVPGSSRMTVLTCKDPAPGQDLRFLAGQGWGAMQRTARALGVQLQHVAINALQSIFLDKLGVRLPSAKRPERRKAGRACPTDRDERFL
jgi:putative ABC transport system substrate-binding protein